jgi:zinc protease
MSLPDSVTSFFTRPAPSQQKPATQFHIHHQISHALSTPQKFSIAQPNVQVREFPNIREVKSRKNFHEFRLANGMTVLFKQSKGTQISAKLSFNSGSGKDPAGKEGLAHFLEHIVCSNTENFKKDIFPVANLHGGYFNAFTYHQGTGYGLLLPNDKLDLTLNILSSVMTRVKIDPEEFKKEHGVINSEIFSSADSIKQFIIINQNLFGTNHPYSRSIIGTKETLDRITIPDLEKFYREEYVPNNATLVISGDIALDELKAGLEKYFTQLKPRTESRELDFSVGIQPSAQKEIEIKDDSLIPNINYKFSVPRFNQRDSLIMSLISSALTDGVDSRLEKKIIEGSENSGKAFGKFISAYGSADKFTGHFSIGCSPIEDNLDANMQAIRRIIDSELEDIAKNGLSQKEFIRLINDLENSEIFSDDDQHAKIGAVETYHANDQDWSQVFFKLDELKKITNEDIKSFASKYLNPANRRVFKVYGKGSDFKQDFNTLINKKNEQVQGKTLEEQIIGPERYKHLVDLSGGLSNLAVKLEGLNKIQHPNGMQVFYKQDKDLPVNFLRVKFPGGSLVLPPEKRHITGMLSAILASTGTYNPNTKRSLDKQQIENLQIKLGSSFGLGLGIDTGGFTLDYLSKNQSATFALVNELLNYPALLETNNPEIVQRVEAEFQRTKKSTIEMVKNFDKFSAMLVSEKFAQAIYPKEHIFYQRSSEEAIKLIESITLDDLRAYYRDFMHAKNAQITAVGDISLDQIQNQFIPILNSWNSIAQSNPRNLLLDSSAPVPPKPLNFQIIEANNNSPEAFVEIGNPTNIKQDDPDFYPARIANMILGAGGDSRLFKGVRESNGLCYHIESSFLTSKLCAGPFSISLGCDPKNIALSIKEADQIVKDFLARGPTAQEIELAKQDLKKSSALYRFNSRRSTAGTLSDLMYRGKDDAFVNNFNNMIDSIRPEQIISAARKFILPNNFTIVASVPKGFKQEQIIKPAKETQLNNKPNSFALAV